MKKYSEIIEYLVQRIVKEIKPLRILIFGSAARDESASNDIDILVVMPEGVHRRRTAQFPKLFRNRQALLITLLLHVIRENLNLLMKKNIMNH